MSFPSSRTGDPVLVLGAGVTGLTAGRLLREAHQDFLILEASDRPGGLCRTEVVEGYTFDYTGHLLHLKEGESKDLIMNLLGDRLDKHVRRASVFVEGVFVDYPIQAHFRQLPDPLPGRCLEELLQSGKEEVSPELSFDKWAVKRFGKTLAALFMIPYNAKLSCQPLEEMEVSWTSWSVPVPTPHELKRISKGEDLPSYGYNATFYYPREGGIEVLPRRLASGQEGSIRTGAAVVHIDAMARKITLQDGEELGFSKLIATLPLPELLRMIEGLPNGLAGAAERFRYSSVLGVCLGLTGPVLRPYHWVYFPDEALPFYRMGFPSNFSDGVAPAGCGSVYAEAAYAGDEVPDIDSLADKVLETLVRTGLVEPSTGIAARIALDLPCAYVFHDRYRSRNLEAVREALHGLGILSVGRYGAWEYSAMQDAVDWGLKAAREVLK